MDEMTVERACEILNEAEWRERSDWLSHSDGTVFSNSRLLAALDQESAIAIATGMLDRKQVVELEEKVFILTVANQRMRKGKTGKLYIDLERELTQVTQELNDAREYGREYIARTDPLIACGSADDPSSQCCGYCNACLQEQLVALRKAASLVVKTCHADSMGYLDALRRLLAAYGQKEDG